MADLVPVLLALAVLLTATSLLLPLAERLALPHTLLFAAFGIVLGLGAAGLEQLVAVGGGGAAVGRDIMAGLARLDLGEQGLLALFLPPLLFMAGLNIDVRLLLDEIAAVLLLAVIAVVVCTGVAGAVLAPLAGFSLTACLLLGAIVATTDPAAVVAIFRDLGAPRRLTTLIEGESLFNDAAAIALVGILFAILVGERPPDLLGAAGAFLLHFMGGLAAGYLFGRLAALLLPPLHGMPAAAASLSVALAYLAFLVGELYLGVSGVVAVVTAALTLSVEGPIRVAPSTWAAVRRTWEQLDFWASSLVFVLAAMLTVRLLPTATWRDLGLLVALVFAAAAARALVLFGLLPLMERLGWTQPIEIRTKVVVLWGGLRGAVTLLLALSVARSLLLPDDLRQFVGVAATGFTFFTLFLAGPTLKPLLGLLGLDRLSPSEQLLRDRVMALTGESIRDQIEGTARQYGFDSALARGLGPAAEQQAPEIDSALSRQVGLLALAAREKELYLRHLEEQSVSRRLIGRLVATADRLADAVKTEGEAGYERRGTALVRLSRRLKAAMWLHRRFGWSRPLVGCLADRFELLEIQQLVLRELIVFNRRSMAPLFGEATADALGTLLSRRLAAVSDALAAVELQYPVYTEALRRRYLLRAALRLEEAAYERNLAESLISREVFADLERSLRERRKAAEARPALDLGLRLTDMVRRVPLFRALPPDRLASVIQLLRARLAYPGERIVREGERGDAMYFIASGEVEVILAARRIRLGPGEFFGELALLKRQPRVADVEAVGFCHLLVLEARDFRRLLRRDQGLKQEIERIAQERTEARAS